MIDYELLTPTKIIKSRRKTLSIIINRMGELIVKCPIYCTKQQIYDFIFKKANWIVSTRKSTIDSIKTIQFLDGEKISVLGVTYTIKLVDSHKAKFGEDTVILPKTDSKQAFLKLIKKFAKNHIENRTKLLATQFNFNYRSIKINSAKSRYGSCGQNNTLNFTFRLMFAPVVVVDYIILHELSHTKEKNHQKPFYKLLKSVCSDYKQREEWLKQNKYFLDLV